MSRRPHPTAAMAAILAVVSLLGACTPPPIDALNFDAWTRYDGSDRTAKEAVIEYTRIMDDIMDAVEPAEISEPLPVPAREREAYPCLSTFSYFSENYSDGGILSRDAESGEILERIANRLDKRDELTVTRSVLDATETVFFVQVENANGLRIYVLVESVGSERWLQMSGRTACFSPLGIPVKQSR